MKSISYLSENKKFLDSHIQSRSFLQVVSPISVLPAGTDVVIIGYKNYPSNPAENNQVTLLLKVNHTQIGGSWRYYKGVTITTGVTVPKEFDGEYCYWMSIRVGKKDISRHFTKTGEFHKEIEEAPEKTSDDKPISNKFSVGDVIIGNSNEYGITGAGQICIVSKVDDSECIEVYCVSLSGSKIPYSSYNVLSKYFDLYSGEKEHYHYSLGIDEQGQIISHINGYFKGEKRIEFFNKYSERVSKKYDKDYPSKNTMSIQRKAYDVVSTDNFSSEPKTSEHYVPPSKSKLSKILLPLIEVKKRPTY